MFLEAFNEKQSYSKEMEGQKGQVRRSKSIGFKYQTCIPVYETEAGFYKQTSKNPQRINIIL